MLGLVVILSVLALTHAVMLDYNQPSEFNRWIMRNPTKGKMCKNKDKKLSIRMYVKVVISERQMLSLYKANFIFLQSKCRLCISQTLFFHNV